MRGRMEILQLYTGVIPLAGDVKLYIITDGKPGFHGAELVNVVNVAAMGAAIEGFAGAALLHLENSRENILMGAKSGQYC